jgi:F-type H+-transporting ATPase subunit b
VRNLVVTAIVLIFAIYCYLAYASKHNYNMPAYQTEAVDILDGASLRQWQSEQWATKRYDTLSNLEKKFYQLPGSQTALKAKDFKALVAEGKTKLDLLNPGEILSFIGKGLRLRNDITIGSETIIAGTRVDKALLDRLIDNKVPSVAVIGSGGVVDFNASVFMIILIFVAMALVLEQIFWKPVMELVDRRKREVEEGIDALRFNKVEEEKIEKDKLDKMREIRSEYQELLYKEKQKTMVEADKISGKAHGEMKGMREQAAEELKKTITETEESLRKELPALAEEIATAVTSNEGK